MIELGSGTAVIAVVMLSIPHELTSAVGPAKIVTVGRDPNLLSSTRPTKYANEGVDPAGLNALSKSDGWTTVSTDPIRIPNCPERIMDSDTM